MTKNSNDFAFQNIINIKITYTTSRYYNIVLTNQSPTTKDHLMKILKNFVFLYLIFSAINMVAQTDFSNNWEDFYSYNQVKSFYQNSEKIIALSDNALFIYNKSTQKTDKISSINGLAGETTSALFYHEGLKKIVIGYENGLVEVIDENNKIYKKPDIINFSILGSKKINHIAVNGNELFFSTPFGIVGFDLSNNNFKNTYFIGDNSSEVNVYETIISNNQIYATTENGLYTADITNPFLIDYNNWTLISTTHFTNLEKFNNQIYLSSDNNIYRLNADNSVAWITNLDQNIVDLQSNGTLLTACSTYQCKVFDIQFNTQYHVYNYQNPNYQFELLTGNVYQNKLYLGTKQHGILVSSVSDITNFSEIHPQGPLNNDPFSISVLNNHLWVVYGGYDDAYTPQGKAKGISHFNGTDWINLPFRNEVINYRDLVHVNIDPNHENRVYVSSWGDGMLVIENDQVINRWNHLNSGLENLYNDNINVSIRIGSSVFDTSGNLWVANAWVANRLKKYSTSQQWSSYNLSSLIFEIAFGLNEIVIDKNGNKWIGTRANGAFVANESASKIMSFYTTDTKGKLPHSNVRALAVDKNNRVWIGTRSGLRYYNVNSNMFDLTSYASDMVKIKYGDDGYAEPLLGNQTINAICVDGADNKWFGTDGAGVMCTNSTGKETLYQFTKANSPLPSNKIMKIRFDETSGKVFFATDKGIVAYNSNIAPYSESLTEVYAYPNPAKANHETVTIDGRNGTHLPYGTNVKILDSAGKLVFETNVKEGQEDFGGKVVWNKTNMAGNKVASGIYIVMLFNKETSETSMTKIAIVN